MHDRSKWELDLDWIAQYVKVKVNDDDYIPGIVSIGDTITIGNQHWAVLGINEDAVVIREIYERPE